MGVLELMAQAARACSTQITQAAQARPYCKLILIAPAAQVAE
jgi:hypothetical protein